MKLLLPKPSTGNIVLQPSQVEFGPKTTESALTKASTPHKWTAIESHGQYARYKLDGVCTTESRPVGIIVSFHNGILESASIFLLSRAGSWDTWSESEAMHQKDTLEHLLEAAYGRQRQFSWGNLTADYDPRSGSSSITIRYTN